MENIKTFDTLEQNQKEENSSWTLEKINPFSKQLATKPRQKVFLPKDNIQLNCDHFHNRRDPLMQTSRITTGSNNLGQSSIVSGSNSISEQQQFSNRADYHNAYIDTSESLQVPPLHNLKRSLDLSKLRTTAPLNNSYGGGGGGSTTNASARRYDHLRKKTVDNKFLQIQIQCSSALDNQGFREVSTAIQNLRNSMTTTVSAENSPLNIINSSNPLSQKKHLRNSYDGFKYMSLKRGQPVIETVAQLQKEGDEEGSSFKRHDASSILSPTYVKMIRDQVFKDQAQYGGHLRKSMIVERSAAPSQDPLAKTQTLFNGNSNPGAFSFAQNPQQSRLIRENSPQQNLMTNYQSFGNNNLRDLLHQKSGASHVSRGDGLSNISTVIQQNKEMLREAYENSKKNMKYHINDAIQAKPYNIMLTTQNSIQGGGGTNMKDSLNLNSNRGGSIGFQTFYPGFDRTPEEQIQLMSAGAYHISAVGSQQSKRNRGFNVLIDAFHNEVNVNTTNKALPHGGFFSPTNTKTSTLGDRSLVVTPIVPMSSPPQTTATQYILSQDGANSIIGGNDPKIDFGGKDLTDQSVFNTILRVEETNHLLQSSSTPKKPQKEPEVQETALLAQKKALRLEKEKRKQAQIAELNAEIGKWKRLVEPVFSGNVNNEVNTIVGVNTRGLPLSLKDEYQSLKKDLESKVLHKGAWVLQPFAGQVPDTREGQSMVAIGHHVYMFGGQGRTMFDELRVIDTSTKEAWNWSILEEDDAFSNKGGESKFEVESGKIADKPGPRTASVFARFSDKIILSGGSGPYISHIKSRRSYYDIFVYDTVTKSWFEDKRKVQGKQAIHKRINHAGDVLGNILTVYGGYDNEMKEILDDFVLYDIEEHAWVTPEIRYIRDEQSRIGRRSKLSVTTVFFNPNGEFGDINDPNSMIWKRNVWHTKSLQTTFSPKEFRSSGKTNFKYGVFIFGGFTDISETATDELWLVQPDCQKNESTVVDVKDPRSLYFGRPSGYIMDFEMRVKAFNLSKLTKGKGPAARFAHQACSISQGRYLLISGGRNNQMYKTLGNIAFNDVHLLNTQTLEWDVIAMYGQLPLSRWNHSLVALDDDKLVIFGGLNMTTYMNSSNLQVFEFGEYAVENWIAKAKWQVTDLQQKVKTLAHS